VLKTGHRDFLEGAAEETEPGCLFIFVENHPIWSEFYKRTCFIENKKQEGDGAIAKHVESFEEYP
jgi:hypothetical protein